MEMAVGDWHSDVWYEEKLVTPKGVMCKFM